MRSHLRREGGPTGLSVRGPWHRALRLDRDGLDIALVLVLLNVADPGHWQVADIRVMNTLLGAAIGLLATTAILPGSERGLVISRSRVALTRSAGYLRAIGHRAGPERLAARRCARAATDDLLAVVDRAAAGGHRRAFSCPSCCVGNF